MTSSVRGYFSTLLACAEATQAGPQSLQNAMESSIAWIREVRKRDGVVHLLGNGGSAAVVSHAQNDLVKGCHVRALVHQDIPTLTAYTNDLGYAASLQGPLKVWMRDEGDVVIAVSSAGMSQNIVQAATAARNNGAKVITLSGFHAENALRQLGHVNFY